MKPKKKIINALIILLILSMVIVQASSDKTRFGETRKLTLPSYSVLDEGAQPLISASGKMRQAKSRHLPILEGHHFLGLISLRDLLEVEVDEQAEELRMLNTYIHYIPPGL